MNNSTQPGQGSAPVIIKVRGVSKSFDQLTPVRNVSFQVNQGEFVILLGPSGSGKSTLLGLLAGFERPSQGSITLMEQDLTALGENELALLRREQVGFVFQAFHLIPTLTGLENVAFPLYPLKMDRQERTRRARRLLEQVGLVERAGHLPSLLSGGERQRVAIARALVNRPALLFCDEPTGNLDSHTGKEILDLLVSLNTTRGLTIFMVTHDRDIVQFADRTLYMHDGEVRET